MEFTRAWQHGSIAAVVAAGQDPLEGAFQASSVPRFAEAGFLVIPLHFPAYTRTVVPYYREVQMLIVAPFSLGDHNSGSKGAGCNMSQGGWPYVVVVGLDNRGRDMEDARTSRMKPASDAECYTHLREALTNKVLRLSTLSDLAIDKEPLLHAWKQATWALLCRRASAHQCREDPNRGACHACHPQ